MANPHPRAPESWLRPTDRGLYCVPGDFHIDPTRPVARAVVTHGHGDHARPDNGAVLATPETAAIMRARLGERAGGSLEPLAWGEARRIGDAVLRFAPAGHVLGSAQAVIEHEGTRVVVSGDYKRRADPTCAAFEPVPCDLFVTEATFGLPVFRHPPDGEELGKLLDSLRLFPERCHIVGVYALGKCQRVVARLRELGYDRPIWLHGALQPLCDLYRAHGVELGDLRAANEAGRNALAGEIVMAPPSAAADRWSRRFAEPLVAMASGWMRVRQRARQRGVELPLVISDHADWDELIATAREVGAPRVWVTHGREEALVHALSALGIEAQVLSLVGYDDEEEEGEAPGREPQA